MTPIINYYTIEQLRTRYQEKINEANRQYETRKRLTENSNDQPQIKKAKLTRIENQYKSRLATINNTTEFNIDAINNILETCKLSDMYKEYTGNDIDISKIMFRKDLSEFYIEVGENKRIWVLNKGTFKYKCTINGKGIRYQYSPILTFDQNIQYEGRYRSRQNG